MITWRSSQGDSLLNPTITLNTYSQLIKARDPEAVKRLKNAILKPTGSKMVAKMDSEDEKGGEVSTVTS